LTILKNFDKNQASTTLEEPMLDIALLQKLSPEQFDAITKLDPLSRNSIIWEMEILTQSLRKLKISDEVIYAIYYTWATEISQLIPRQLTRIAFDLFQWCDEHKRSQGKSSSYARSYAILLGSWNLLLQLSENAIEDIQAYHFLYAGSVVEERVTNTKSSPTEARQCFSHVITIAKKTNNREHRILARVHLRRLLNANIELLNFEGMNECAHALERDDINRFTVPEQKLLRRCIAKTIRLPENRLTRNDLIHVKEILTRYGSDSEKRAWVKHLARIGEKEKVEHLANAWDIPITMKHFKLLLGTVWFDQKQFMNHGTRIELLTKMSKLDSCYKDCLDEALARARSYHIGFGSTQRAHNIAQIQHKPLTQEELTHIIRSYQNDERTVCLKEANLARQLLKELVYGKPAHVQPAHV